ncbi:hypothetical protein [Actinomadura sp. DC4]|uniref:hypothetical protein n=1 Tax=Actinomadura sp. DC4 TaxID=3055069 RepID=UPI0025AF5FEE|nr:hypothetical protein [Actinomadura sp. DC4]
MTSESPAVDAFGPLQHRSPRGRHAAATRARAGRRFAYLDEGAYRGKGRMRRRGRCISEGRAHRLPDRRDLR